MKSYKIHISLNGSVAVKYLEILEAKLLFINFGQHGVSICLLKSSFESSISLRCLQNGTRLTGTLFIMNKR